MAPALVAPCGRRVPGAVVHGHSACLWAERASAGRFLGRSPGGLSNTRHDGHNICNSGSFPSCYRNRLRPRVCGLVVASATSMDGGVSPVPQRPGGGPPASTREDLVLQRLRRADSVRGVLDIYRQVGAAVGRGGAAAAAGGGAALLMEVLRALARATGKLSNADLAELQALLPGLLRDLSQRLPSFPSLRLLSDVAVSLGPVLEAARAQQQQQQGPGGGRGPAGGEFRPVAAVLPALVCRLALALATAARNELGSPVMQQRQRITLIVLREALMPLKALLLTYGSAAPAGPGGYPQQLPVAGSDLLSAREAVQELVAWAVAEGPGRLEALRGRGTSIEELAAAVQLMTAYGVRQTADYVNAVMQRVDELVAAATPSVDGGGKGGSGAAQKEGPGKGAKGGKRPPGSAAEGAASSGDEEQQRKQQGGQGGRAPKSRRAAREAAASASVAGPPELDVASLAALLASWCAAPPAAGAAQQAAGQGRGLDDRELTAWAEWVAAKAEAVWLTQHGPTQARRTALAAELAAARERAEASEEPPPASASASPADAQAQSPTGQGQGGGRGRGRAGRGDGGRGNQAARGQGKGQAHSEAAASPKAAEQTACGSDSSPQAAAAAAAAAAVVRRLSAELAQLGPTPAAPSPPPAPSPVPPVGLLVDLMARSGGLLGGATGRRACGLAEEVLLGEGAQQLSPPAALTVLVAFRNMGHRPSEQSISVALRALQPALLQLPAAAAAELLPVLLHATTCTRTGKARPPQSPTPQEVLGPVGRCIAVLVGRDEEAGEVVTALVVGLVRLSAAWGVPLEQEEVLQPLARVVERRLRGELPLDSAILRSDEFKAFMARTAGTRVSSGAKVGSGPQANLPSTGSSRRLLDQLVEGVLLPLAQLGHSFPTSDSFAIALANWRLDGFPGLDARKAAALLGTAAANKGWVYAQMMRKDLDALLAACLSEEALSRPDTTPQDLSWLLLEGARVMRLIVRGGKVLAPAGGEHSIATLAAPVSAPLLLPAVEWLLALGPDADALAAVAQALFVELEGPLGTKLGAGGGPAVAAPDSQQDCRLLPQLLQLTAPFIAPSEDQASAPGCSLQSCAWLLAACARCGYLPPAGWLVDLYRTAARQLQATSKAAEAPAEVLVSLIASVAWMEDMAREERVDPDIASQAGHSLKAEVLAGHRQALLAGVAVRLLQGGALSALRTQPDELVAAVRRLAVLGVQPGPGWVAQYTDLLQDDLMLPVKGRHAGLSAQGLAQGAEALALLGGAPRASWVDTLLRTAEGKTLARGKPDWRLFDSYSLGLLLGAVHVLRGSEARAMAGAVDRRGKGKAGRGSSPLSTAAEQALIRAYSAFVSNSVGVMPRYTARQLYMVVGAIASHELERAGGAAQAKGGAMSVMQRVEAPWIEQSSMALQRCLAEARSEAAAASARALPPPALVLDLLRLACQTLLSGGVCRPGSNLASLAQRAPVLAAAARTEEGLGSGGDNAHAAAQAAGALLEWVEGTLQEYAGAGDGQVAVADWYQLLTAALEVGMRPPPAALEAYCDGLCKAMTEAAAGVTGAAADGSSQEPVARRQAALWEALEAALGDVLLPALPWAPGGQRAAALREGVLLRVPLQAASTAQQALMCTYCAQAGAGSPEVWARVAQEMQRRVGAGEGKLLASDAAALCYALDLGGAGLEASLLSELHAAFQQPGSSQALASGWSATVLGCWERLSALHHLWVARSLGRLHEAPEAAWRAALAARDPSPGRLDPLDVMSRRQCAQLVLLLAEAPEGVREEVKRQGGKRKGLCGLLLMRLYGGALPGSGHGQAAEEAEPAVVAAAVLHCLPGHPAPAALWEAALDVLASPAVPLAQAAAMLSVLEGTPAAGHVLTPEQLQQQVEALLRRDSMEDMRRPEQGQEQGEDETGALRLACRRISERKDLLAACTAGLLALAPAGGGALALVLPLLDALVPQAEAKLLEFYGLPLPVDAFLRDWDGGSSGSDVPVQLLMLAQDDKSAWDDECDAWSPAFVPPADLWSGGAAQLATALLTSAGWRPLPRSAAAVALWLLSYQEVVQQVPVTLLRQGLAGCLQIRPEVLAAGRGKRAELLEPQGELELPLPLSDATAVLLGRRVQPTGLDLALTRDLWACGARPDWLTDKFRSLLDTLGDCDELKSIMRSCDLVAATELLAHMVDTWDEDLAWWKRHEDAYETAIAELLPTVWTMLPADVPFALPALESVAWMTRHAWVTGWQSYKAVLQHWQRSNVTEGAAQRLGGKDVTAGAIHCSSAGLAWRLLDCCYDLGPLSLSEFFAGSLRHFRQRDKSPPLAAEVLKVVRNTKHCVYRDFLPVASRAPYLLTGEEAYGVVRPLLGALEADLRGLGAETRAQLGDSSEGEDGGLRRTAQLDASYAPTHSARQVGLVYGALTIRQLPAHRSEEADAGAGRGTSGDGGLEGSLKPFSAQWYGRLENDLGMLYVAALEALEARVAALDPLAHLTAVLDAVEPLVVADVCRQVLPPGYYERPAVAAALQALRAAVERVLRMDCPEVPAWVAPSRDALFVGRTTLASHAALRTYLSLRTSTLPVPQALRPKPGRRHGDGSDPEGDAAREAFLDEVQPWYQALKRLEVLLVSLRVGPAAPTSLQRAAPALSWEGVGQPGAGRWAQACWQLLGGPGRRDDALMDDYLSWVQTKDFASIAEVIAARVRGEWGAPELPGSAGV